jgi:hypothetical protein
VNFGSPTPAGASAASVKVDTNRPHSSTSSPNIESPDVPTSPLEFNPPICVLLQLMDIDDPAEHFKYVDFENEF